MAKRTPFNTHNRIRQLREAAGIRRADFATEIGIGASTLARYESSSFAGSIAAETQRKIAETLGSPLVEVFPKRAAGMSRRQFVAGVGALGLGVGLAAQGLSAAADDPFGVQRNRQTLSQEELRTLADDNYATWEQFNTLQVGSSLDFTAAVAQGKLVTLKHLAQCSLPDKQRFTILALLGDTHLIVSRVAREQRNFGDCEQHLRQAMAIGAEINNPDLKTASREYYGSMLVDQDMLVTAEKNGQAILEDAKGASFPIWAEAHLTAAYALAYTGRYAEAKRIADRARLAQRGPDPDIWVGHLTNPDVVYSQFEIVARTAAQRNYEAVEASEASLKDLAREQPDNLQFSARLKAYRATALWQMGSIEEAVSAAEDSLTETNRIGSILNYQRIEKLYHTMRRSRYTKHPYVRELGEMIMAG